MRKELRAQYDKLKELHNKFTAARESITKFKDDSEAAKLERDRLLDGQCDPYVDADCLALTVVKNRAELLAIKAERTEQQLPELFQAASDFSQKVRGAAIDLLAADAKEIHAKAAAKLVKTNDMAEGDAHEAAKHIQAVRDAWVRHNNAQHVGGSEPFGVLQLLESIP